MTPQELRELAGIDVCTAAQANKKWAEQQLKQNIPPQQQPIQNLMDRLGQHDKKNYHTPDVNLVNLAHRLNGLLGSDNFKVQRL